MVSPSATLAAIGLLVSLSLTSACSSGRPGSRTAAILAPAHATTQGLRPLVPRQFPEVPEADWTIDQPWVGRELACRNGKAGVFDCHNVTLLAYLPEHVVGEEVTGLWGWTDPVTGREFVVAAQRAGTSFVEVTDPLHPRYLGQLPVHQGAQPGYWRDVKVYKNHAFIVSDNAGPHGLQVFDLTQLRTVQDVPAVFQETAHYDHISAVHTLAIDTASGFAYAVGSNGEGETCGGGLHMVDIRTPSAPTFAGCYAETLGGSKPDGYIHEAQCVVYQGPDSRYRGRQICLNAAVTALGIVDVTDKRQPQAIGVGRYPNVGYTHQGWLTEDQRYFVLGDEADELAGMQKVGKDGVRTRTIIFDLQRLDDPVVATEFFGTTVATDHNLYIRGHYVYQSNYRAGLRVLDLQDPVHPQEVGYFDTTPGEENTPGWSGTWSNYPYFKQSGLVAVSTFAPGGEGQPPRKTTRGLFLLRYRPGPAPR